MIRLFQSKWTAWGLGLIAYIVTTILAWHSPTNLASLVKTPESASELNAGPSWTFSNPELEQVIADLHKEKEALAGRETQLKEWESRLQAERLELNQITQAVYRLQVDFDKNIVRIREEEVGNLKRLARTYTAMSPEGAAAIFKQMDDAALIKILLFMKDTDTAPVLEAMAKPGESDAKRTAALSERLRQSIGSSTPKPTTR